mgnify:CR=1 FL=1
MGTMMVMMKMMNGRTINPGLATLKVLKTKDIHQIVSPLLFHENITFYLETHAIIGFYCVRFLLFLTKHKIL